MAWYDDESKLTQIVTYKNAKEASKEANSALKKGWTLQGSNAASGHANVGRSAAAGAAGVALIGAHRPDWPGPWRADRGKDHAYLRAHAGMDGCLRPGRRGETTGGSRRGTSQTGGARQTGG